MSREFDSRKNSHPTKFGRRTRILVKLSFRDFQLSAFQISIVIQIYLVYVLWIIWQFQWIEKRSKSERQAKNSWDTNPWNNFRDHHWKFICNNKLYLETLKSSTPLEIAIGTYFHIRHGTKTTPVFLFADREVFWLLLPSSVSLLSGSTVQPEDTYSCILKVKG